jgi:circadian clock protein KaiB
MKPPIYLLRLYVNRSASRSVRAIANLKMLCEQYLRGRYVLEVIDIVQHADLARADQIVALPTLIKRRPLPFHRLVGDMSDPSKVLCGLNLEMRAP